MSATPTPDPISIEKRILGWANLVIAFALLCATGASLLEAQRQRGVAERSLKVADDSLRFAQKSAKDAGEETNRILKATLRLGDAGYETAKAGQATALQTHIGNEEMRLQGSNSVLFAARAEGQRRYLQAYGTLDGLLERLTSTMPHAGVDLEDAQQIKALTIESYKKMSVLYIEAPQAFSIYWSAVDGARGVWPEPLEEKIFHSKQDAYETYECFSYAARAPMTEMELVVRKNQLLQHCGKLRVGVNNFRDAMRPVIGEMMFVSRKTLARLGVAQSELLPLHPNHNDRKNDPRRRD